MGARDLARQARRKVRQAFDPEARLVERVAAGKRARAQGPAHLDKPRLSLILLSFNHRGNIPALAAGLNASGAGEIIVCDDGSIDGSEREWQALLSGPNAFLIRSNDIHDSRIYNRAAGFARGEFIAILQDDDIPPASSDWVRESLALFDRYPKLAVLGGHQGWILDFTQSADRIHRRAVYGYRDEKRFSYARDIPFLDPVSSRPFMFVQGVSIGPILYRRDVFQALGGFNLEYSEAGEVGMLVDHELSLRAWLAGHQVALCGPMPFRRYVGGQGTVMFGAETRTRNLLRSFARLQREYGDRAAAIDAEVDSLNASLTPVAHAS
jgi:GT2 family glycosyltransferase